MTTDTNTNGVACGLGIQCPGDRSNCLGNSTNLVFVVMAGPAGEVAARIAVFRPSVVISVGSLLRALGRMVKWLPSTVPLFPPPVGGCLPLPKQSLVHPQELNGP